MQLRELIKDLDMTNVVGSLDTEITDIAYHTRDVKRGGCFIAIPGNSVNGHEYVDAALEKGASAVVSSRAVALPSGIVNVIVQNPRLALALMSSRLFGEPSRGVRLVGVTGTNGKTTITYLLESIWKACGFCVGVVGTVNYRYGDISTNPSHTTPESYELQRLFSDMKGAGIDSVAMEVSSHSLDQERVAGCQFDGAIFTNLTQDHLDYHLDMERYKEAKKRLFTRYLPASGKNGVWAVINADDGFGRELAAGLPYTTCLYSLGHGTPISLQDVKYSFKGTKMRIDASGRKFSIKSRLIGRHNASNILGAVGASFAMGISDEKIKAGVEAVTYVPGRLEPVANGRGLHVFVDYAHTPDALKNVTTALKELEPGRLITVFGCGGDRDKTKRPLMGFEAGLRSDFLIITSDNPRGEDPQKIIDEIVVGVKKVGLKYEKEGGPSAGRALSLSKGSGYGAGYVVEVDRKKAIEKAISIAGRNDVVLIAGKGHEDYQIIGREKLHFDDKEAVREALNRCS